MIENRPGSCDRFPRCLTGWGRDSLIGVASRRHCSGVRDSPAPDRTLALPTSPANESGVNHIGHHSCRHGSTG